MRKENKQLIYAPSDLVRFMAAVDGEHPITSTLGLSLDKSFQAL